MMRLLKAILPIYVFVLILIPCSDGEYIHHQEEAYVHTLSSDNQHSSDCEKDDCSPFCVCSCCRTGVIITVQGIVTSNIILTPPDHFSTFYRDAIFLEFIKSLFHPPVR